MLECPPERARPSLSWPVQLTQSGIGLIEPAFPSSVVTQWNALLDPLFQARRQDRSYVGADILANIGIIHGLMTPEIRALIALVTPTARIYHCHAYEIEDHADRPHIHADRADGWHRDTETVGAFDAGRAQHLSLFVYLSDVGPHSGAFEFFPRSPSPWQLRDGPAHSVLGPSGTAFVWNRSYYHRASPNFSATRRRVLKISWQDSALPNDSINGEPFRSAAGLVADDDFLQTLFSLDPHGALSAPLAPPSPPIALPYNASLTWKRSDQVLERLRILRHQVAS
jgi:hypothetical protein